MFIEDYWKDKSKRRALFENYAKSNGFDPLLPKNWDNVTTRMIFAFKVNPSLFHSFIILIINNN